MQANCSLCQCNYSGFAHIDDVAAQDCVRKILYTISKSGQRSKDPARPKVESKFYEKFSKLSVFQQKLFLTLLDKTVAYFSLPQNAPLIRQLEEKVPLRESSVIRNAVLKTARVYGMARL
jgi:hypothetical protein